MRKLLMGLGGLVLVLLVGAGIGIAVWARGIDVAAASADLHLEPDPLGAYGDAPPVTDSAGWDVRAPLLRSAFEREIYGQTPDLGVARVAAKAPLEIAGLEFARVEEWPVELADGRRFNMLVVAPKNATGTVPVIVMELFCSVRDAVPGRPEAIPAALTPTYKGCGASLVTFILGRYISGPPFETVLNRGYALALFYPGDVVADDAALAAPVLEAIGGTPRAGALGVWAQLYSKAYDVLAADQRFDASRIAIWGHSRHGKSALLAGASDPRFWAVIAHQSGRFGASPTESERGESRAKILEHYGYWFTPGLTEISPLSVDQHVLIALNAPTPLLLTHGAGDFWSDPSGAWRAAQAASPVYRLLGSTGFTQTSPDEPDFSADLVYAQRPGGHGVTTSDWRMFLSFLDAHRAHPAHGR
jgi:hypothetical protein